MVKPAMFVLVGLMAVTAAVHFFHKLAPHQDLFGVNYETLSFFSWLICLIFWMLCYPLYEFLYYQTYFYDADEENITIRKGVVVRREAVLPFSRITDVYVDQDLLDVILGLYDVHLSTPTEQSGRFAHIDGVSKKSAVIIKELVLESIKRAEKK